MDNILNVFIFTLSFLAMIKSADLAIKYASDLAHTFRFSKYVTGFIIVALISILPETFISIASVFQGIPSFGLGVLFGSNVADLTLVFALVIFSAARGIKVGSKILEDNRWYPLLLALPIILGIDGYYSRINGVILIVSGFLFYYWVFRKSHHADLPFSSPQRSCQNFFYLALSMAALLVGSYFTVKYGVAIAETLRVSPILVGMLVVGLGTTLPELFFSLRAVKQKHNDLALGDILGTVISDATIIVGILALVSPFSFPQRVVWSTGVFMFIASLILFAFMRSGKILTKKEGFFLFLFYAVFVIIEYILNTL